MYIKPADYIPTVCELVDTKIIAFKHGAAIYYEK